jgi:hypothetical protein
MSSVLGGWFLPNKTRTDSALGISTSINIVEEEETKSCYDITCSSQVNKASFHCLPKPYSPRLNVPCVIHIHSGPEIPPEFFAI